MDMQSVLDRIAVSAKVLTDECDVYTKKIEEFENFMREHNVGVTAQIEVPRYKGEEGESADLAFSKLTKNNCWGVYVLVNPSVQSWNNAYLLRLINRQERVYYSKFLPELAEAVDRQLESIS